MSQIVRLGGNGTAPGSSLWLWCPGCDDAHRVTVGAADSWTWNNDTEAPTIAPSIAVSRSDGGTCHSFVRGGQWQFLADSTHALAGRTVPVIPLPAWLDAEYVG